MIKFIKIYINAKYMVYKSKINYYYIYVYKKVLPKMIFSQLGFICMFSSNKIKISRRSENG
jgi:hypothetical protein